MITVASFDIGAFQQLEATTVGALFAGPGLDQAHVHILGEGAQELDVVRARKIEGVDQQEAGVGGFDGLVDLEGRVLPRGQSIPIDF
ncbi:hypothetical protein D3C72_1073750 [compost metagenome]